VPGQVPSEDSLRRVAQPGVQQQRLTCTEEPQAD
jgi:hypothetical protein